MYELIPLLAGCAAGLCLRSLRSLWLAAAGVVAVAVAAGTIAATVSGELEMSAVFLLWDIGQGVVAGVAVLVLTRRSLRDRPDARRS